MTNTISPNGLTSKTFLSKNTPSKPMRLILEGLANLAMKPNETMNELLTRITQNTWVIKENFTDYGGITPYPPNDINHRISNQAFQTFKKQYTAMMFNFFKMNFVQGCTDAGTQICGSTTGSGSHDGQKDLHGGHHSPKRGKRKIIGHSK
jgi:hypothetical protein